MKSSIAAALLALLAFALLIGSEAATAADAAMTGLRTFHGAYVGTHGHGHFGGRPHSSYYPGRPVYYSPGPLFPWLPFIPDWRDPSDW